MEQQIKIVKRDVHTAKGMFDGKAYDLTGRNGCTVRLRDRESGVEFCVLTKYVTPTNREGRNLLK